MRPLLLWSSIPPTPEFFFGHGHGRGWMPIDDYNTASFAYRYRTDRPLNDSDMEEIDKEGAFTVELRQSGETLEIQSGQTILEALLEVASTHPFPEWRAFAAHAKPGLSRVSRTIAT